MGTIDYMPPEQAENTKAVDHRADIYSLGCTFYALLMAQPVYSGDTTVIKLLAHREAPIPSLRDKRSDVPEGLDAVFQTMIAKSPDDRYGSMTEVLAELEKFAGPTPEQFSETTTLEGDSPHMATEPVHTSEPPHDESLPLDIPVVSPVDNYLRTRPKMEKRQQIILGSVVAAAFLAIVLFGVVFSMKSSDETSNVGTVQPESPSAPANVAVAPKPTQPSTSEPKIAEPKPPQKTTIPPEQQVANDSAGGTDVLPGINGHRKQLAAEAFLQEVEERRKGKATLSGDPDRQTAELVLRSGGTITLYMPGKYPQVSSVEQLPASPFQISCIDLSGTSNADETIASLPPLPKLATLVMEKAKLTDIGIEHVTKYPALSYLNLYRTAVTDEGLGAVAKLDNIAMLNLRCCKVTDAGLGKLKKCSNLDVLRLAWTRISDDGLSELSGMKHLRVLDLDSTKISDKGLEQIKGLAELGQVDLPATQVTDTGLQHLKALKKLTRLNLSDTRVTAAGVADLQAALPNCKIVWGSESSEASETLASGTAFPLLAIAPFTPQQAKQHQQAWADHLGLPVEFENSIGMKMVLIPPGSS